MASSPDAWVDHTEAKLRHDIPLTRHFELSAPPRRPNEIDASGKALEAAIKALLDRIAT